ncbi:MAG: chemotaxis protein CheD [Clostridiales bacterium]|jgi:chemotaxis protein CheD|nr:chemotaxis protein CheD [Clostridiales bacterium]
MANNILIGIADLAVGKGTDTLTTLGLGSCVGLVLYDRLSKIGGMAHIMLPQAPPTVAQKHKAQYGDTAFEELLSQIVRAGANPYLLVAKMAGGAHMFATSTGNDVMKVGQRNIEICHTLLQKRGIRLLTEDTGGSVGRTIVFYCETGALTIRTAWPKTEKTI